MEHLETKIGEYAVILNDNNEFLLLQFWENHSNKWHFPGGRLEHNDESVEGLKREVKEETNLDIFDIKPFFTKVFDKKSPKYGVFFTAKTKNQSEIKISDEHQAYRWYKKTELDSIDFKQPFYRKMLEDIL